MKNSTASEKAIVITVYVTMGMLGAYFAMFQYTILDVTRFFLPDITLMGVLIGIQSLGMCIAPLFFGWLSEKIGKRKVILIAFMLFITGTLVAGVTPALYVFIAAIFLTGSGFSVVEATLCAVLADEFPKAAVRHLNFSQVVFSAGALAGPIIAKTLIDFGIFFKTLYSLCAIMFVLLGIAFFFTKQKNDIVKRQTNSAAPNIVVLLKSKGFLLLAICVFIYVGVEGTMANFSGSYFELVLNAPQFSAAALSLFWGAMIPSRFLAGLLKFDLKKMIVAMTGVVIVAIICGMLIPGTTAKLAMFALCGFGCGPLWPLLMNAAVKKSSGASGLAMNAMLAFCSMGGALLPLFAGMLANATSQTEVYYLCGAATGILLILYLRAAKENRSGQN